MELQKKFPLEEYFAGNISTNDNKRIISMRTFAAFRSAKYREVNFRKKKPRIQIS
jgi:hypothetical protein